MATYDYQPHQKQIIFNDDPDLIPIKYNLPSPPVLHKIDGFGLKPEDQIFQYQKMPKKLYDLNRLKISPFEKNLTLIGNFLSKY